MLSMGVKHDFDRVMKQMEGQQKQVRFAAAVALTQVAQEARTEEYAEMRRVFDRPNPFTLKSLFLDRATKDQLKATVWLKDDYTGGMKPGHYLLPQIQGGSRVVKPFERALRRIGVLPDSMVAVPASGARMDAYGNMERGHIVQVLSYLQAFGEQGYSANITAEGRKKLAKGTKKKQGIGYFVVRSGDGRLPAGVWQRFKFASGYAIKPVLLFYTQASYRAIFNFDDVGQRAIAKHWPIKFEAALKAALASARP